MRKVATPGSRNRLWMVIALLAALSMIAAACGADDDEPAADDAAEPDDAPEPADADDDAADDEPADDAADDDAAAEDDAADGGELETIRWISPRGTLDVMDDYNLWVPIEMGYFEELGLDVELIAGPTEATAPARFVAEDQADVGYPSPGVLTSSIDTGVPVKSIFGMMSGQTFNFALPEDSDITSPEQLEGATISVADAGWEVIIDPILVEVGVDPDSVTYVEAGQQWGQQVALGQVDAGLAWEGLRAQWAAQGLEVDFLIGQEWSQHPSNVYSVRAEDLEDPEWRDRYVRFIQGIVMGFEFAKENPQAAAQLTYRQLPDLQETVEPQLALDSLMELGSLYGLAAREGNPWGYHDEAGWQDYLDIIHELEQTDQQLTTDDVYTDELLEEGNDIDLERVRADAQDFELDDDFAATEPRTDVEM